MPLLLSDPVASGLLGATARIGCCATLRTPASFSSSPVSGWRSGSWVGAAVALLIMFAGMLPRIRVEERALTQAFGTDYADHANSTARILPQAW